MQIIGGRFLSQQQRQSADSRRGAPFAELVNYFCCLFCAWVRLREVHTLISLSTAAKSDSGRYLKLNYGQRVLPLEEQLTHAHLCIPAFYLCLWCVYYEFCAKLHTRSPASFILFQAAKWGGDFLIYFRII